MARSELLRIVTTILLCIGAMGGTQVSPAVPVQTPTMTATSTPLTSQSFPGSPCLSPSQADISTGQLQPTGQNISITGHVVPNVRSGKVSQKATMPDSAILHLELVFKLRNRAAFDECLASLSDPTSWNYGHFLDANTLRPYAPTPGQKQSLATFLQKGGFNVTYGPSPIVLELSARVGSISETFGMRLRLYQQGSSSFYSPDSDPKMPQNLGTLVNAITGMDNFSVIRPVETPCGFLGAYPDCPQGVQVGYGLSSLFSSGYNGNGQTVAIVDAPGDPNIQTAINTYDTQYGLTPITLNIQYPDGPPASYDSVWAAETAMDVEAVHSVAPGAGIVLLYDGNLLNAVDYAVSHNLGQVISNSWRYTCGTICSDTQLPPSLVSSVDTRLAIDAAEGFTLLFGSGDEGAKPDGTNLGTEFPASDPNVLAVGATNLALAGCGINSCSGYGSESGALISGGGYSGYFAEPTWQILNIGSKSGRAVPDISMFGYAPNFWVYSTLANSCGGGSGGGWFGCAGTSLSTPLWAGFLAVALQVRGGGLFGNIGPRIYQLANSPSYSNDFHDITSGSNNGYSAGTGWDPVTGWGTPTANNLASDLAQVVVSTDKSTYTQGDFLQYTGSGLTAGGQVSTCLSTNNDGSLLCTSTTADKYGNIAGTMQVGTNIPAGQQKFLVADVATSRFSNSVQLTILALTVTTTTTTYSTSTFTTYTTTSSTSTFRTATTTTSTSVSTSTVGQVCSATSTTQTTSVIVQATATSSSTSITTTTTSSTSTFLTTTSSTSTSTSVTTTTTTITVCTQTSTSTSTSTTFTTFTRPSTTISLVLTPNSVTLGSSLTLSGSISPSPGAVLVSTSFSRDSGATWAMLMSVMTDSSGNYSTGWTPPSPGNYQLEATWSGNDQLAGSTGSPASLMVTGTITQSPTLLLSAPSTASQSQAIRLSITVFNPSSAAMNANVTIQITGPGNYIVFDVIQVKVAASSQSTVYYDWTVPNQPGAYAVTVGLLPPRSAAFDSVTIQAA